MASLNSCEFIGNLGADPEVKSLNNGNKVANLSLACSESWKDKNTGEKKERTEWIRIVIFNEPLVKVAQQYLKKGMKIYIQGSMQTRKWQDQSGNDKYSTEIVLQAFNGKLIMLDSKGNQNSEPAQQQQTATQQTAQQSSDNLDDDSIPF